MGRLMEYRYSAEAHPSRYATNLTWNPEEKRLRWNSSRGQDVLIVQTPFEENFGNRNMERLCREMGQMALPTERFVRVSDHTEVRFLYAWEGVKGCPGNGEACTYAVYPCVLEQAENGPVCRVLGQGQAGGIASPVCQVPLRVQVEVEPDTRQEGLFRRREVSTGFYRIRFSTPCDTRYQDGALEYQIDDFLIPITRRMFEQGEIFVRTDIKPMIVSRTKGIALTQTGF